MFDDCLYLWITPVAALTPPHDKGLGLSQEERVPRETRPRKLIGSLLSSSPPRQLRVAPRRPTSCPPPPGRLWSGTLFDSCSPCPSLR